MQVDLSLAAFVFFLGKLYEDAKVDTLVYLPLPSLDFMHSLEYPLVFRYYIN